MIEHRPIYGEPGSVYGHVLAGIHFGSHPQARLLADILEKALVDYAGKPQETLIAKWHRQVVSSRRKAERDAWAGWEERSER